jgi:hypothetical protein
VQTTGIFTGIFGGNWGLARTVLTGETLLQLERFQGGSSIAKELCLSVKTISSYRTNILLKTKMKNNAEITYYANQNKLVD